MSDTTRERNRRLVLEQISLRRQVSRQEIVDTTGLSKAAISLIVAELIESGLVYETGRQNSSVGRPRVALSFTPDARYLIGAELNSQECRVILTNLYAEPLRTVKRTLLPSDLSPEGVCQILVGAVNELVIGIETGRIVGMGVAVPAVANPTSGVVVSSVILPWQNVPFGDYLRQAFAFPSLVFSRGSAATWGERWYGAGREIENLLYVRVGNGVVAGLVLEGQPYWGVHFGAGELGHVTVKPDGELCRCGNRGCLATVATTEALVSRVRQLLREDMDDPLWEQLDHHIERLDFATLVAAAISGNRAAKQGFAEVARWLALAISSAIHLVDLQMVIVGGPMIEAGELLFAPLRAELAQRTLPTHFRYVQIVPSLLREDAPSIGAASLVLHQLVSAERMTPLQPGVIAAVR